MAESKIIIQQKKPEQGSFLKLEKEWEECLLNIIEEDENIDPFENVQKSLTELENQIGVIESSLEEHIKAKKAEIYSRFEGDENLSVEEKEGLKNYVDNAFNDIKAERLRYLHPLNQMQEKNHTCWNICSITKSPLH